MSRFISKSVERALPFFKILKKAGPMKWTPAAEAALQDLKRYLSSTLILVAPRPQELLLLYLAATNQVVSVVLVAEREVEEVATTAARPSDEGPRLAGSDAGKAEPPAESGSDEIESVQVNEATQKKKKVVQHLV